jgi:predicted HNH restriction endonuclease
MENPATLVHHLHYETLFREMLFDLVAVCENCHSQIHTNIEDYFELQRSDKILLAARFLDGMGTKQRRSRH